MSDKKRDRDEEGVPESKRVKKDDELDLYWACRNGSVKWIRQRLDGGEDVNGSVHRRGSTPILVAAYWDQAEATAYLLERGADPMPEACNQTALHLAAHRGSQKSARALLEKNSIGPNCVNDEDETPLFVAAYAGQSELVSLLMEFGANVERACGTNGLRPLHIASEVGAVACARLLLQAGAHVDAVDNQGETGLYKATEADRLGAVVLLLQHGADPVARVPEHGRFPLFAACERGRDLDIVAALAGNSSDLDLSTDNGYTSLYVAARYNLADVVRLMLGQGADPNRTNKYGETALFAACRENHDAVVKVLLAKNDTKIHCASERWSSGTPLHVVSALDHVDIARRLLAHNAQLRTVARDPASLLHVICSNGWLGGDQLNYADIDLEDADGNTPLALALEHGSTDLARLLFLNYKARPPPACEDLPSTLTRPALFQRILKWWRANRHRATADQNDDDDVPI